MNTAQEEVSVTSLQNMAPEKSVSYVSVYQVAYRPHDDFMQIKCKSNKPDFFFLLPVAAQ